MMALILLFMLMNYLVIVSLLIGAMSMINTSISS